MIDVADLLGRLGIPFKRSGSKLLADCPARDHADTTQRWMIRDDQSRNDHGRHRCLSCGFGGGPVKLVMEHLEMERGAALDFLRSSDRGAPVKLDVEVQLRERVADVEVPDDVQFSDGAWPHRFNDYLQERGVDQKQRLRWELGWVDAAPSYSALRNRIWLPVYSVEGKLSGWTARTTAKNATPKYLSSSRADGTDEGVLFGEAFWPPHPELRGELVVVEGPFDALAIDRLQYHVAALRGSEIAPAAVAKLATWKRLLVATDPDRAGYKAATALHALSRHVEVRRVRLPEGVDVADLAVSDMGDLVGRLRPAG